MASKMKTGANAIAQLLLVIGILVAVNAISTRVFGRVDLTEDQVFTLSAASKQLAKDLPDRVIVKAFISKDQPPRVAQIGRYLRDLLDEYKAASGGKVQWEALDPAEDKKHEEEAKRLGISSKPLQELSKDKFAVKSIYLGLAFEYGDKSEKIPLVASTEGLEYQISSILKRLTVKKKKIGFVQGFGCAELGNGLRAVQAGLGDYEAVPVNLAGEAKIPDDVDGLVVYGPKQPVSDAAKREIDRFLMQGKAVAFFVDGMVLERPQQQMAIPGQPEPPRFAKKNDSGLEDLLAGYGFKVAEDMVLDVQAARAPALVNGQMFLINQPFVPIATDLADKHLVTERLKGVIFPFASSVELVGDLKDGKAPGKAVALARSTPKAWHQTGFFLYDPQMEVKRGEPGVFTFGYAYEGKLPSAYNLDKSGGGAVSSPDPAQLSESAKPVRLIVMGDSDFAHDETIGRGQGELQANWLFTLNAIDWMVQDEALVAVRGKVVTSRPLSVKSESAPTVARYANAVGLPLVLCLFGLVRWRSRKSRRATQTLSD